MTGLVLYMVTLLELSGIFVPYLVALKAMRRAQRSVGFNRWIYGYFAAFALFMAVTVLIGVPTRGPGYALAIVGSLATLPTWLWICDQMRATPTRFHRNLPHPN